MPTVSVDKERFLQALGEKYTTKEFDELCFQFGIELDDDTTEEVKGTDERPTLKIDIPANRYDLLCHEGISRALRVFLGKEPQPVLKLSQPAQMVELNIHDSVRQIRPYASAAILRGIKFTAENYASFIDLQDKLHQNLARRRTLVAIGTHDLGTISGPFTYEALPPQEIKFAPLNRPGQVMDGVKLMETLESDRHLNKYLPIIRDSPVYPVILDKDRTVCSLPPIINSEHSKITLDTRDVFIDMTATDETRLESAMNILVSMFSVYCSEPFTVEPVKVTYLRDGKSSVEPSLAPRKTSARVSYINTCTGLSLKAEEVVGYLQKMGHEASLSKSQPQEVVEVDIPCTRPDVLQECDLMEDVAVAFGFDNLPRRFPSTNTVGAPLPINKLSDLIRRECAYAGWVEVLPLILCSRAENFSALRRKDDGSAIALENPQTAEFQVVRTSLLPGVLKTVRENRKHSLPLRTFEVSDVAFKDEETDPERCARNERHVTAVYCDKSANFEVVHGLLDRLMRALDVPRISKDDTTAKRGYYLVETENPTFFPGRAASIFVRGSTSAVAEDALSSHGPPAGPILDSAVTTKATSGSADIEQPKTDSKEPSSKVTSTLSSAADSLGKALSDIVSGKTASSVVRKVTRGGDVDVGLIGVLHPEVLSSFELDFPCSAMEFDLEVFL